MPRLIATPWENLDELLQVRNRLYKTRDATVIDGQETAQETPQPKTNGFASELYSLRAKELGASFASTLSPNTEKLWQWRREGLEMITMWKLRTDNIPYAIICTGLLLEAKEQHWRLKASCAQHTLHPLLKSEIEASATDNAAVNDENKSIDHFIASENTEIADSRSSVVKSMYAIAILRLVTGFCDSAQNAQRKLPMYTLGVAHLGFPASWVELRHIIAHGIDEVPPLKRLEEVTNHMLTWLWKNFWAKLDQPDATVAIKPVVAAGESYVSPKNLSELSFSTLKTYRNGRIEIIRDHERQCKEMKSQGAKKRKSNDLDNGRLNKKTRTTTGEFDTSVSTSATPEQQPSAISSGSITPNTLSPIDQLATPIFQLYEDAMSCANISSSGVVSSLVDALLGDKMLIPKTTSSTSPSSPSLLTGAFCVWDHLLAQLDSKFPTTFSQTLLDKFLDVLCYSSDPYLMWQQKARSSTDKNAEPRVPTEGECAAIIGWIVHLLSPSAARNTSASPFINPGRYFSWFAPRILDRQYNYNTACLLLHLLSFFMDPLDGRSQDNSVKQLGQASTDLAIGIVPTNSTSSLSYSLFKLWKNTLQSYIDYDQEGKYKTLLKDLNAREQAREKERSRLQEVMRQQLKEDESRYPVPLPSSSPEAEDQRQHKGQQMGRRSILIDPFDPEDLFPSYEKTGLSDSNTNTPNPGCPSERRGWAFASVSWTPSPIGIFP